eukprot:14607032-Alexandrium_andersonii.AAC.1
MAAGDSPRSTAPSFGATEDSWVLPSTEAASASGSARTPAPRPTTTSSAAAASSSARGRTPLSA